jgi:hypothetical protein
MTKEEYANFKKMSDAQLLDFVTETQGSQRGHLARYIIGSRPHDTVKRAPSGLQSRPSLLRPAHSFRSV